VEAAAYRIIQESLTNIARHAGVTTCRVRLRHVDAVLRVDVEDAGRGFKPSAGGAGTAPGLGLIGMRERVTALGGSIGTGPRENGGFRVRADLPVR
jgi:signal transduction histidine kinase